MPKQSKIRAVSSRPSESPPLHPTPDQYQCCRCGRTFKRQFGNFSVSHSPINHGNGGYLPICIRCMDDLHEHYVEALGSDKAAIERLCMKFDIYWNPAVYDAVEKKNTNNSRIRAYLSKINIFRYTDKTYDDTMDEKMEVERIGIPIPSGTAGGTSGRRDPDDIDPRLVRFWGAGLLPEVYESLDGRYQSWTEGLGELDKITIARYKQICILEEQINRAVLDGKSTDALTKTLNSMLTEVNKDRTDASDEEFDTLPFGVGIKMCENTKPIPKPIDELRDVDGVIRYLSIWFVGHILKMLGIKNTYSKMYEDAIAQYRVERPELEEEDDETVFNEIFSDSGGDG